MVSFHVENSANILASSSRCHFSPLYLLELPTSCSSYAAIGSRISSKNAGLVLTPHRHIRQPFYFQRLTYTRAALPGHSPGWRRTFENWHGDCFKDIPVILGLPAACPGPEHESMRIEEL